MRSPLRIAGYLAVAVLAVIAVVLVVLLVGPGALVVSPAETTAVPTPEPPTTAVPGGRQATSGEEQMKDGCEHGGFSKAECDRFFTEIAQDGVRFDE